MPQPTSPGSNLRRLHLFFSGRVQGVGFRYRTQNIAAGYDVTGIVRNRSDGRVEIVAEGGAITLEAFLQKIEQEMSGYIDTVEKAWEAPTGEWPQFAIAPTY